MGFGVVAGESMVGVGVKVNTKVVVMVMVVDSSMQPTLASLS